MTAVQPPGRFGAPHIDGDQITSFQEKPEGEGLGLMVAFSFSNLAFWIT